MKKQLVWCDMISAFIYWKEDFFLKYSTIWQCGFLIFHSNQTQVI